MKRTDTYTRNERRAIVETLSAGVDPACPRCGATLDEWPVPPRGDVSYVRDRIWLVCGRCSCSAVLDRHMPGP